MPTPELQNSCTSICTSACSREVTLAPILARRLTALPPGMASSGWRSSVLKLRKSLCVLLPEAASLHCWSTCAVASRQLCQALIHQTMNYNSDLIGAVQTSQILCMHCQEGSKGTWSSFTAPHLCRSSITEAVQRSSGLRAGCLRKRPAVQLRVCKDRRVRKCYEGRCAELWS